MQRGRPENQASRPRGSAAAPASAALEHELALRSVPVQRDTSTGRLNELEVAAGHRSAGRAWPAATRAPHTTEACRHATHTTSWLLSRHEGPGGCMCEGRQARAHSCAHLGKRCALWTRTMKISAPSRVQMHAVRGPPSRWSSAHAAQPRAMDELRCGSSRQELGVARGENFALPFREDEKRKKTWWIACFQS